MSCAHGTAPVHPAHDNACVCLLLGVPYAQDGYTALLVAVQWQLHDCVRLLLDRGADVNGGGARGIAPLRYAAQNAGSTACLELLLARGANLDAVGGDGCTALQAACAACNDAAVALLLKAGAAVGKVQPDGSTALHVAARAGSAACVELMLRAGAALEATDKEGRTPLLCAAQCGHTDCLELLLSVGAKVRACLQLAACTSGLARPLSICILNYFSAVTALCREHLATACPSMSCSPRPPPPRTSGRMRCTWRPRAASATAWGASLKHALRLTRSTQRAVQLCTLQHRAAMARVCPSCFKRRPGSTLQTRCVHEQQGRGWQGFV